MMIHEGTSFTARSVAGGSWLIAREGRKTAWGPRQWVADTAACREEAPQEVERIAAMGRALLLGGKEGEGRLRPHEVQWLLALPRRLACLVDFLTASVDPALVLTTPLRVTFTPRGEVRWHFAPVRRAACRLMTGAEHRRAMKFAA